jgi:hypothetical protein
MRCNGIDGATTTTTTTTTKMHRVLCECSHTIFSHDHHSITHVNAFSLLSTFKARSVPFYRIVLIVKKCFASNPFFNFNIVLTDRVVGQNAKEKLNPSLTLFVLRIQRPYF